MKPLRVFWSCKKKVTTTYGEEWQLLLFLNKYSKKWGSFVLINNIQKLIVSHRQRLIQNRNEGNSECCGKLWVNQKRNHCQAGTSNEMHMNLGTTLINERHVRSVGNWAISKHLQKKTQQKQRKTSQAPKMV